MTDTYRRCTALDHCLFPQVAPQFPCSMQIRSRVQVGPLRDALTLSLWIGPMARHRLSVDSGKLNLQGSFSIAFDESRRAASALAD